MESGKEAVDTERTSSDSLSPLNVEKQEVLVTSAETITDTTQSKRAQKREKKRQHAQQRPRKKRDRRKGIRENHLLQNVEYKTNIEPLELDGVPVPSTNGWLRTVEPYPHTHATHAKARWLGRTILDVYSTEFGSYPKVGEYKMRLAGDALLQIAHLKHLTLSLHHSILRATTKLQSSKEESLFRIKKLLSIILYRVKMFCHTRYIGMSQQWQPFQRKIR